MHSAGAQRSALLLLSAGASIAQQVAVLLAASAVATVPRAELRRALPGGRPRLLPEVRVACREGSDTGSSVGNNITNALRCALADFERQGFVSRVGGDVRVLDRAGLRQVAGVEVGA